MSNSIFEDDKFQNFMDKHGDQLKGMAKNINPATLADEKQLRQTLKMLANIAKVPADDKKIDQIVNVLKKQKFDPNDPNSVNKMLGSLKKKK